MSSLPADELGPGPQTRSGSRSSETIGASWRKGRAWACGQLSSSDGDGDGDGLSKKGFDDLLVFLLLLQLAAPASPLLLVALLLLLLR